MKTRLVLVSLFLFALLGGRVAPAHGSAPPTPMPRTYVVASGDTLVTISQRFGVSVAALAAANGLANPNLIRIGQRLVIPPTGVDPASVARPRQLLSYHLRPGETLGAVARRFGVSTGDLLLANGVTRANELCTETDILVPVFVPPALPAPFLALTRTPGIIQGQTGIAYVTLAKPTALTGTFGPTLLAFAYDRLTPLGYRYWTLLPTSAITPTGDRILTIRAGDAQIAQPVPILPGAYETQHIVLPPAKGELLAPDRTRPELERLLALWTTVSDRQQWQGLFAFPVASGFQQTSPYGTRRSYNGGPVNSFHAGADWSAPEGTPIQAPAAGTVILAEKLDVRGGAVILDHGLGVTSNFWHLSRIDVVPGQRVARGQILGLVGTTGLSTAAHMHWEMRLYDVAVDPLQWTQVFFPHTPAVSEQ